MSIDIFLPENLRLRFFITTSGHRKLVDSNSHQLSLLQTTRLTNCASHLLHLYQ